MLSPSQLKECPPYLPEYSALLETALVSYEDQIHNVKDGAAEKAALQKYGEWVDECIQSMNRHDWPAALIALRYLFYVGKQPGELEHATLARNYATTKMISGPDYATAIYSFFIFALNDVMKPHSEKYSDLQNSNKVDVLLMLLREIAAKQCHAGFSENIPTHKSELIYALSASKVNMGVLEKLFQDGRTGVVAENLNISTDTDVCHASRCAPIPSILEGINSVHQLTPHRLQNVLSEIADSESMVSFILSSPSPKRVPGAKLNFPVFTPSVENFNPFNRSVGGGMKHEKNNGITDGLIRFPFRNIAAGLTNNSTAKPEAVCTDFIMAADENGDGINILAEINNIVDVLSPANKTDNGRDDNWDFILRTKAQSDLVPWHDFEALDSSTWLEDKIDMESHSGQNDSIYDLSSLSFVNMHEDVSDIKQMCAAELSSVYSEGEGARPDGSGCESDASSIAENDVLINGLLNCSAESHLLSEQLYATDGCQPIAELSQFMVVGSDLFTMDTEDKQNIITAELLSPEQDVLDNQYISLSDSCSEIFDSVSATLAISAAERVEMAGPKIRYFRVIFSALFPGNNQRHRVRRNSSRFRSVMVSSFQ